MSRSNNSRKGRAKQGTGKNGHGCGRRCEVCYPGIAAAKRHVQRRMRFDEDGEEVVKIPSWLLHRDCW